MTETRECDYCDTQEIFSLVGKHLVSNLETIGEAKVCPDCKKKGIHESNEKAKDTNKVFEEMRNNAPIDINEVLRQSREVDSRVTVKTDIFNAATVAIVELKKSIDEDASITNKPFTLANELLNRFNHFKSIIFELNEKIVEASNNQKAIQIYLNNLANSLRAEEREKLKISDINYKPKDVKTPITAKTIRLSKKKFDKNEIKKYSNELGLPEFTFRAICIQKNLSAEDGFKLMKASIEQAKAQSI